MRISAVVLASIALASFGEVPKASAQFNPGKLKFVRDEAPFAVSAEHVKRIASNLSRLGLSEIPEDLSSTGIADLGFSSRNLEKVVLIKYRVRLSSHAANNQLLSTGHASSFMYSSDQAPVFTVFLIGFTRGSSLSVVHQLKSDLDRASITNFFSKAMGWVLPSAYADDESAFSRAKWNNFVKYMKGCGYGGTVQFAKHTAEFIWNFSADEVTQVLNQWVDLAKKVGTHPVKTFNEFRNQDVEKYGEVSCEFIATILVAKGAKGLLKKAGAVKLADAAKAGESSARLVVEKATVAEAPAPSRPKTIGEIVAKKNLEAQARATENLIRSSNMKKVLTHIQYDAKSEVRGPTFELKSKELGTLKFESEIAKGGYERRPAQFEVNGRKLELVLQDLVDNQKKRFLSRSVAIQEAGLEEPVSFDRHLAESGQLKTNPTQVELFQKNGRLLIKTTSEYVDQSGNASSRSIAKYYQLDLSEKAGLVGNGGDASLTPPAPQGS